MSERDATLIIADAAVALKDLLALFKERDREIEVLTTERDNALLRIGELEATNAEYRYILDNEFGVE